MPRSDVQVACSAELDELKSSWPTFLEVLDTEPIRARELFYVAAYRYLLVSPPKPLMWYDWIDEESYIVDLIDHFLEDDFRRLRQYRNMGRPFLYWFRTTTDLKARDIVRRIFLENDLFIPIDDSDEKHDGIPVEGDPLLIEKVEKAFDSFRGTDCYCLLVMRLERWYTNREIVRMMHLPKSKNSVVGNRYRECRMKLIARLETAGVDIGYLS